MIIKINKGRRPLPFTPHYSQDTSDTCSTLSKTSCKFKYPRKYWCLTLFMIKFYIKI